MKSNQLQKLTFENMSHILDSNDLKVMSELDVFAATLKWIMYDHSRWVSNIFILAISSLKARSFAEQWAKSWLLFVV